MRRFFSVAMVLGAIAGLWAPVALSAAGERTQEQNDFLVDQRAAFRRIADHWTDGTEPERMLKDVLAKQQALFGKDSPFCAHSYYMLGKYYRMPHQWDASVDAFRQCRELRAKYLGETAIDCAEADLQMIKALIPAGKTVEAEKLAIDENKKAETTKTTDSARVFFWYNIAFTKLASNKPEEALPLIERAIALKKKLPYAQMVDPTLVQMWPLLAECDARLGKPDEAVALATEYFEKRVGKTNGEDERMSGAMLEAASQYEKKGQMQRSLDCLRLGLDIQRTSKYKHPPIVKALQAKLSSSR
jgi:tetratricopeptide (TPR) repeat protein